ncbi:hypothetical protein EKO04_003069 [Ascochyta lentis]|uniref:Uncharacterized protein n=1 Tax=Ascochyta lentis TaxID=205686 RepID=A0A8H7MJI8_9PLEO|nr:hypothetical protein EKO04_003069 [Ascochyta lentis]
MAETGAAARRRQRVGGHCKLPAANCQLPTAHCPLPTAHCRQGAGISAAWAVESQHGMQKGDRHAMQQGCLRKSGGQRGLQLAITLDLPHALPTAFPAGGCTDCCGTYIRALQGAAAVAGGFRTIGTRPKTAARRTPARPIAGSWSELSKLARAPAALEGTGRATHDARHLLTPSGQPGSRRQACSSPAGGPSSLAGGWQPDGQRLTSFPAESFPQPWY